MNTREQQDKEYRAQWIRDAAKDFCLAQLGTERGRLQTVCVSGPLENITSVESGVVIKVPPGNTIQYLESNLPRETYALASSLWEKYEQERK